jgi:membrane-associated phospholipid phosphatase
MLQRHRVAAAAAAALGVLGVALLVALGFDGGMDVAQGIDDVVRSALQDAQWGGLEVIAETLEILGAWYVTWPLRLAVVGYLLRLRRWEQLWAWLIAIAIYEPLVGILKNIYERPRPPLASGVTSYSFPSGHAVVGAAVAIGIVIVLVPAGPRRRLYEYLAGWFAFLMAMSRVYLDAHWFSDVVAGTFIGAAVMIGTVAGVHEIGDLIHRHRIRGDLVAGQGEPPTARSGAARDV